MRDKIGKIHPSLRDFSYLCENLNVMIDYTLVNFMEERLKATPLDFKRYMYDRINWNSRMIGL